jgi:aspartyl-tRNA(Asn)/glutamyl-tRNA(Gln) amidotransferase subunit C
MNLTKEQVEKIAYLARLGLNDAEIEKFSDQLTGILDYVDMLNEVDTENVDPTSQVTGLESVMEEDEVIDYVEDKSRLLEASNLPKEARQILVKSIFND